MRVDLQEQDVKRIVETAYAVIHFTDLAIVHTGDGSQYMFYRNGTYVYLPVYGENDTGFYPRNTFAEII
jgi:hypothetical protein